MTLPTIAMPGNFPCWLAAGHDSTRDPVYAHTPMRSGHTRQRRVYTTAPETRNVSLLLNQVQVERFFLWFENDIIGGSLEFSARVHMFGPGMGWWAARFVEPYKAEPMPARAGILWRVTAKLSLRGEPSEVGPELGFLASEIFVPLQGRAVLDADVRMFSEIRVPLAAYVLNDFEGLESEIHVPLIGEVDSEPYFNIVADGSFVVVSGQQVIERP